MIAMKKMVILLGFLCLVLQSMAQGTSEGIRFFDGTFEEALALAKKENKLIFMDCYGTWCGGCRRMDREVFPMKIVGDFYNENFICLKRNMQKGEGIMLCERYSVAGFPTWLFINEKGYVVHISAGFMKAEVFVELGKSVLKMPRKGMEERFAEGERSDEFLHTYLEHLKSFAQMNQIDRVLAILYKERGGKFLEDSYYWNLFMVATYDQDAETSRYVAKHWRKFARLFGLHVVVQKIRTQYVNFSVYTSLCDRDEKGWRGDLNEERFASYIQKLKKRKLPQGKWLINEMYFLMLLQKEAYEEAYQFGESVLKNPDSYILCNWATLGEKKVTDPLIRKKIAVWAERAVVLATDTEWRIESEQVLKDLKNSEKPVYGVMRKSLPVRGYVKKEKK